MEKPCAWYTVPEGSFIQIGLHTKHTLYGLHSIHLDVPANMKLKFNGTQIGEMLETHKESVVVLTKIHKNANMVLESIEKFKANRSTKAMYRMTVIYVCTGITVGTLLVLICLCAIRSFLKGKSKSSKSPENQSSAAYMQHTYYPLGALAPTAPPAQL